MILPRWLRSGLSSRGGLAAGELPRLRLASRSRGSAGEALSALPSFTNPNNCSLNTGAPPSVHGGPGNFYLDRRGGETVMVTGDKCFEGAHHLRGHGLGRGASTVAVTAKLTSSGATRERPADRAHGYRRLCAERANAAGQRRMGSMTSRASWAAGSPINIPPIPRLFVLDVGVRLAGGGPRPPALSLPGLRAASGTHHRSWKASTSTARSMPVSAASIELGCRSSAQRPIHAVCTIWRARTARPTRIFVGDVLDARFLRRRHLPSDLPDHRSLRPPSPVRSAASCGCTSARVARR